jgi:uncharacterized protein (TIGR03032 family)
VTEPSTNLVEAASSVHTRNFPGLLKQLKSSLLATTTLPMNRLIVLRGDDDGLHTDFLPLKGPMGLVADSKRILVGGRDRVYEFLNMPTLVGDGEGRFAARDAVYLMRNVHVTGPTDIHDMAFTGEDCWCANTRFSCLSTLDQVHSFVPRWRPRFISGYAPGDRCHLNGLAVQDGRPKYVTALGESNEIEGWRTNQLQGGLLIEVDSGEIVIRGLSMPHSPRFHRDRLWLLESAKGALAVADPASGTVETVMRLPGFARGLDFFGPLAFVGLSKIRVSNARLNLAASDENPGFASGVWVVNIETLKVVAFLRFSEQVDEIFALHVLQGVTHPHISTDDGSSAETAWVLPEKVLREVELVMPGVRTPETAKVLAGLGNRRIPFGSV